MQLYTGETRSRRALALLKKAGVGRLFSQGKPTPYSGELWIFDNGAYTAYVQQKPFPEDRFVARVDHCIAKGLDPTLAVLPDIVGDGERSLDFSLAWLEELPQQWPWYLAVQDGMHPAEVRDVLKDERIRGIFLGGTLAFKATAASWLGVARSRARGFHFARSASYERLMYAYNLGSDSADTTQPLWEHTALEAFCQLIRNDSWQRDCFVEAS